MSLPVVAASPREYFDETSPWVRAFNAFGIAFIAYDRDGLRRYVSSGADALTACSPSGSHLFEEVDRLVTDRLARTDESTLAIQPVSPTHDMATTLNGIPFGIYVARPNSADLRALVVFPVRTGSRRTARIDGLSRREMEVALLIAAGLATKQIAFRLGISGHTARHHTERVFSKLGVRTRVAVAAIVLASQNDAESLPW